VLFFLIPPLLLILILIVLESLLPAGTIGIIDGWLITAIFLGDIAVAASLTPWTSEQSSGHESRLFTTILESIYMLDELRKVQMLQFSASVAGRRKILRARETYRKKLRAQARDSLILCSKLTGIKPSDGDYFKCTRMGAWLLYASKNTQQIEVIDGCIKACGTMLEHLLQGRPWDIADIAPTPDDVDALPPTALERAKNLLATALSPVYLPAGVAVLTAVLALVAR
jgi:hypothetical protein